MKFLALQNILWERLRLPEDFRERVAKERNGRRAKSVAAVGQMRPIMVRSGSLEVIVGANEVAACVSTGLTMIRCEVVDCTHDEIEILRAEERFQHERYTYEEYQEAQGRLYLAIEREEILKSVAENIRNPGKRSACWKNKRHVTARIRAKHRVAERLGISVTTVTNAARVARRRMLDRAKVQPHRIVRRYGMVLTEDFEERLLVARKGCGKLASMLHGSKTLLGLLRNSKTGMDDAKLARLAAMLREAHDYAVAISPVGLCPYCKGLRKPCNVCVCCGGSAMLSKEQESHVDRELKDTKNPVVYFEGEFHPLEEFAEDRSADVRLIEKDAPIESSETRSAE